VGDRVLPAASGSLPFLRLENASYAIQVIGLVTTGSSVLALGFSSWLVRLPR
jgi:hypothetical protein